MKNPAKKTRAGKPKALPAVKRKTESQRSGNSTALSDRLLHELQVHQVELEAQNQELREAHALLEESRDRYADLYDLAPIGYVTLTAGGLVQGINLPGAAMLGIERSRLIGLPFTLYVANGDKARFRAHLRHCQNELGPATIELHLKRKDGCTLDMELHTVPIPDRAHKSASYLSAMSDTTERKRMEAAVRETESRFRAVFAHAGIGIAVGDLRGRILQSNPALQEMLGYSEAELANKDFAAITHPDDRQLDADRFAELLHGERDRFQIEKRYLRKDDTVLWARLTGSLVRDSRGEPLWGIGMVEDIGERKRAEGEIRELNLVLERNATELAIANQELDSFAYSISHDLRTPLASIDSLSRVMQRDYGSELPVEGRRVLNLIHENALAMSRLIEDLLGFARTSRQPMNKQTVAMAELVREIIGKLKSAEASRRVEIVIGDLPPCEADPALLSQVWINLLSNALKFTRKNENTRIEIGAFNQDNDTVYFVRDNGAGFDMEQAGRLFGVFQRLHSEDDYPGTGVGLAIVERIVRRHGGRIWAEAAVGQGAHFFFTLA